MIAFFGYFPKGIVALREGRALRSSPEEQTDSPATSTSGPAE
jgi:hypothetical protein